MHLPLTFPPHSFIPLLGIPLLYLAYVNFSKLKGKQKETNIVVYSHDNLIGDDTTSMTVAGKDGPSTSIMHFGTLLVHDCSITVGPDPNSKRIGQAQTMYLNCQSDGRVLYLVFSLVFTEGEYKGSTLEIQGNDPFGVPEREFSVIFDTGFFRFVKGYGIMTTEFFDIPNLRGIIKLNITVRHF